MAALALLFGAWERLLICPLPHRQMESMVLKLQRLQQKAILDDDYDAGEWRPSQPTSPLHITEAAPSIYLLLFMTQGHAGFRERLCFVFCFCLFTVANLLNVYV